MPLPFLAPALLGGASGGGGLGAALPWIGKGLLGAIGLKGLFGGGKKKPGQEIEALFRQFPQLRRALELQSGQAERADPLHAALIQLSQRLLPGPEGRFTDPYAVDYEQALNERRSQLRAPIRVGKRTY